MCLYLYILLKLKSNYIFSFSILYSNKTRLYVLLLKNKYNKIVSLWKIAHFCMIFYTIVLFNNLIKDINEQCSPELLNYWSHFTIFNNSTSTTILSFQ